MICIWMTHPLGEESLKQADDKGVFMIGCPRNRRGCRTMKNSGGADEGLPGKKVGWGGRRGGRELPDVKADVAEPNDGIVHDRLMRSKDWM